MKTHCFENSLFGMS